MTKGVKITLAAVILIFCGSVAASAAIILNKPDSAKAEILQDNQLLYTLDVEKDAGKYRITDENGGYNVVEIYGGEVFIAEADCPDQTCVKMGKLDSGLPIVCLPHKLVIKFADED